MFLIWCILFKLPFFELKWSEKKAFATKDTHERFGNPSYIDIFFREIPLVENYDWPRQRRQGARKGRRQEASQGPEGQHPGEVACICALFFNYSIIIQGITKPAIRRLARRGGVKRISGLIYEETRGVLKVHFFRSSVFMIDLLWRCSLRMSFATP